MYKQRLVIMALLTAIIIMVNTVGLGGLTEKLEVGQTLEVTAYIDVEDEAVARYVKNNKSEFEFKMSDIENANILITQEDAINLGENYKKVDISYSPVVVVLPERVSSDENNTVVAKSSYVNEVYTVSLNKLLMSFAGDTEENTVSAAMLGLGSKGDFRLMIPAESSPNRKAVIDTMLLALIGSQEVNENTIDKAKSMLDTILEKCGSITNIEKLLEGSDSNYIAIVPEYYMLNVYHTYGIIAYPEKYVCAKVSMLYNTEIISEVKIDSWLDMFTISGLFTESFSEKTGHRVFLGPSRSCIISNTKEIVNYVGSPIEFTDYLGVGYWE